MAGQYDPGMTVAPNTTCPACGERAATPWREASASDRRLARSDSYPLLRCRSCGSAWLAEPATESDALYERGTYAPTRRLRRPIAALRRLIAWDRRRVLGDLPPGARVLEVGAGRGRLVADLAARGHRARGIEPAPTVAAEAREAGAEVETAALERTRFEPGSFDRVVLWHVFEHLDDPVLALERVRPWLASTGALTVAVPNLSSLQARIGGDRWFHQDVPRHRTQFTAEGLVRLLERSGYRTGGVRHVLVEHNPLGMWLTLLNRLTRRRDVPFHFLKRNRVHEGRLEAAADLAITVIAGPLLVPVAVLLELGAGLARRGGTVAVTAVPKGPEPLGSPN
jgi:2-polyprenyl-3-methyl-5-hydroxy-6-metoxy-1,4-benzoquinol methylase